MAPGLLALEDTNSDEWNVMLLWTGSSESLGPIKILSLSPLPSVAPGPSATHV